MLTAKNITCGYGRKVILSSLSATIERGLVTALVGPNGSGKSTLMRSLAGRLRPFVGSVHVEGNDLYRLSAHQAAQWISYVPQETPVPFAFTVEELIGLGNQERQESSGDSAEAIAALDLEPFRKNALTSLSGGEQQRATIARGLSQKAECLLLDEPTAHLDLQYQAALFRLLHDRSRRSGTAVLLVLHDLALAARYADRIVLLKNGIVKGQGTVDEVLTKPLLEKVYDVPLLIRKVDGKIVAVHPQDDLTFS